MDAYLLDWANLLLRWLHVITAIAWVGSSFYFVFLDSSLTPPVDEDLKRQGVSGELWAVHGGGFYHPVKFELAPPKLPAHLHWFYWESYATWMSGFGLLVVSYLWNAQAYLVDKAVMDWSPAAAIAAAIGLLVGFWLAYDAICRVFGDRPDGDGLVGLLTALLVVATAFIACQLFPGRAAFLLTGAALATAMTANVAMWIIPGQRKMVASIAAGGKPDPIHGLRGKQRSVHNTYFTLPVLVAMLSNHYSFLWTHPHNWIVLVLLMAAGAAIRQFFVLRHGWKLGRNGNPLPYAAVGVVILLATIAWLVPAKQAAVEAPQSVGYTQLRPILEQRCMLCHGEQVQMKNVRLDTPEAVKQHAAAIHQQVVITRLMPLNNSTAMTDAERAAVAQWFKAGAPVQ
jgi:uncharacterized membrane protein